MTDTQNVRKFLDLNTGHVTKNDSQILDDGEVMHVHNTPYGWLVYVPDEKENQEHAYSQLSEFFNQAIDMARLMECDYILFDGDGPFQDGLQVFDW